MSNNDLTCDVIVIGGGRTGEFANCVEAQLAPVSARGRSRGLGDLASQGLTSLVTAVAAPTIALN